MNSRFKHNAPTLVSGDDLPPTPCLLKPEPFDVLMDSASGPTYQAAVREANAMCVECPARPVCHVENQGEAWVQRLLATAPALEVPTRGCLTCSKVFEIGPRQGQKRYCSDACNKVAWRAARAAA